MAFPTTIFAPMEALAGIPPKLVPKVAKLVGGMRYADLLLHLPTATIDRRHVTTIAHAEHGTLCTLRVQVVKHQPTPRGTRAPWRITVTDETGIMTLVFFNGSNWLKTKFPEGKEIIISGTVEALLTEKQILHPEAMPASRDIHDLARLWPVYPLTAGITQNMLAKAVGSTLATLPEAPLPEWLPPEVMHTRQWPDFLGALRTLHLPRTETDIAPEGTAHSRLAFDEMLAWQMALLQARQETRTHPGIAHPLTFELRQRFLDSLPFTLTGDQQKVIAELDRDMTTPEPMLHLVQGDVGAGKTFVAFAAALRAIAAGYQVAMMAPTEILAQQHFINAQKYLAPLGVTCVLLTGKQKAAERRNANAAVADGSAQLVFGTHALIQKGVAFKALSLVIIDEQHRFGVRQRLALSEKGIHPDILVMTATPIPRTLALTAYGDMDISVIREKPPGRTPIKTTVNSTDRLDDMAAALQRVLDKGEQVYWVCPLVDESEKTDLANATQRCEHLQQIYGAQVALLHGKMKPAEKEATMQAFKDGQFGILVSTTVIEVGVDVPNATTMIIEHAERFGLSQLHQLRGRVGRGSLQSHCILLYAPPLGQYAAERLDVMRQTEDGFIIAEKDLELRGPGETLGTAQSGHIITKIADLQRDKHLIVEARNLAKAYLSETQPQEVEDGLKWLMQLFGRDEATRLMQSG
ncbi:MAG: ATP-dependent DNA helicase RecG [Proteobacteria bacterium]|nr:ATP-dependent DNA helicase RecG [Pseudomonadota bacterium]